MADVFISYPRAARAKAEIIKDRLQAAGLQCFFDMEKIDGGENFPDIIDHALRGAKAVVCCWSPQYFASTWCMIECRDALEREIIVPVAIETFDRFAPPADLRQVNWFDLADWRGEAGSEAWARTLARLEKLVGRELIATPARTADGSTPTDAAAGLLADLRATWATFPARGDAAAVQRFLERVQEAAPHSGIAFEIEHHLDELRRASSQREEEAARAAAARAARERSREEAHRRARELRARPGEVWRDALPGLPESACPEMVTLPPGSFAMGSAPDEERGAGYDGREEPQHDVRIDYRLALGNYPVTFAEWDAAIAVGARLARPVDEGWGRDRRPVIGVSWNDAQAYIAWLNARLGLTGRDDAYRLPSEAEWEYACRSGAATAYATGATLSPAQACFRDDGHGGLRATTARVGEYPANGYLLHDMHGNVFEWCEDAWNSDYAAADRPDDGAPWRSGNTARRVVRGGAWNSPVEALRAASRGSAGTFERANNIGFRLARSIAPLP